MPKSKMTGPKVGRGGKKKICPTKVEQICRTRAKPQQIVATRLLYCLQYPVPIQVVCKGFTPAHMIDCNSWTSRSTHFRADGQSPPLIWFTSQRLYFNTANTCGTNIVVSGTDSDLEAFSHNPADDSFAPLPDRTGANTKYLNERFLSY
jgi:hypothetical protein